MDQSKFELWVKKILATEEVEISCSDCFERLPAYVEVEISGTEPAEAQVQVAMRQVKVHLNQCLACRDEYETLRDFLQSGSA